MQYNVYDYGNQFLEQIEARDSTEAWAKARNLYGHVLDVRPMDVGIKQTEGEIFFSKIAASRIASNLRSSMLEERTASNSYNDRAEYARANGDEVSAKLWEHIAEEEIGHYNEFNNRLNSLGG